MAKNITRCNNKREVNKDSFRRLKNRIYKNNKEVTEKVPVFEFVKKVIIHIPDKNFRMVRYFGYIQGEVRIKIKLLR